MLRGAPSPIVGWSRAALAVLATLFFGCGFPQIAFESADAGDAGATPFQQDSAASSGQDGGPIDANASLRDVEPAEGAPDDGATQVDATDAASPGDATVSDASPADAARVEDVLQDALEDVSQADGASDASVNCDCGVSQMWPTQVTCSTASITLLCTGPTSGFSDNGPACGETSSHFVTCQESLSVGGVNLGCGSIPASSPVVQQCLP